MQNESLENKKPENQHKSDTALREEGVLAFWRERKIFERSLEHASQGDFVFYDGPPFATGLPHMGHLLGSSVKDVVGRYKTMQGYRVPRTWGWDCHGLPIENIVEKKLGLKSKKDILALGIETFNEEARSTVLQFTADWKRYVERLGRWVDFDHSYKTMENSYIEGVWWALKKIYDDKRLYEGKKVLVYCPHCETPLSKAEIAMDNSYKDVTDEAVFVRFKVLGSRFENAYILAWTTTPWTLPGNMALAVKETIEYIRVEDTWIESEHDATTPLGIDVPPAGKLRRAEYIVAKERYESLKKYFKNSEPKIVETLKGSALVGQSYEPLYDIPKAKEAANDKPWTVQAADFVTTEDGTGVVHIAPMYGEDDYELGKKHALPMVQLLDPSGTYNEDAPELVRSTYYKKGGKAVIADLESRGLLFAQHAHTHSYPHCYRCGTPLIYNALTSWFIDIQSVKQRLIQENVAINWYPEHLKEGRFKHIVEGAPDWSISRNRFWASPLPIWKHEKTGEIEFIGSVAELRAHTKRSGNRYLFLRHGEAESNVLGVVSSRVENQHHLTDLGREQVKTTAQSLRHEGVTRIVSSPLLRTRESAELIAREIGYDATHIIHEDRFKEWQLGSLDGKPVKEIWNLCPTYGERFTNKCADGETLVEMKRRIGEALYDLETTYQNETILIVGHEYTVWLAQCVAEGANTERSIEIRGRTHDFIGNGELRTIDFVPLPHNAEFELDLHRPYIDTLPLVAEDGARLVRIPEVVDCWVESGSMPVAAGHELGTTLGKPQNYPGDFIAEYIAQTRTWFYYMHAMGVLLFNEHSFKNCVTTGTVLAQDGNKMSKSKGNFTDPLENIDRFGADALRLYLLGSVVMQSEDMSFRDDELKDVHNRFIGILWNTYKFYEMYDEVERRKKNVESTHILDRWILARLAQLTNEVTEHMDRYDTVRSIAQLRDFVSDLSTWYLRRSRDRMKGVEGPSAQEEALATFRYVLLEFATLLAPLAPFVAESMYQGAGGECESVHLATWPKRASEPDTEILDTMARTREIVSTALELRSRSGIKVRQPLASLTIPSALPIYEDLVLDELNVKAILSGSALELDTVITPELKREGEIRELIRTVQELRKDMSLQPNQKAVLLVATDEPAKALIDSALNDLNAIANIASVEYGDVPTGKEITLNDTTCTLLLRTSPTS